MNQDTASDCPGFWGRCIMAKKVNQPHRCKWQAGHIGSCVCEVCGVFRR